MNPYVFNISSAKSFLKCRLRWYYEWVLNRVPNETPLPLTFGKILHEVFEEHLNGMTMPDAIRFVESKWRAAAEEASNVSPEDEAGITNALDAFKDTAEALTHWQDLFSIDETLEVETPFEFVHPDDSSIVVRGRPDRVVVSMGRIFHMQHRSLAAGRNIAQYTEPAKLDMHELVYAYHLRTKYAAKGLSYGGTIFNIIRKLKYRGVNGKILNDPSKIFGQYAVWMDDAQITKVIQDLGWLAREMRRTIDDADRGILPAHARDLNAGIFGNRIDPYFYVFTGQRDLFDDRFFKPREDTYAGVPSIVEEA
jgi:hypothetical protein